MQVHVCDEKSGKNPFPLEVVMDINYSTTENRSTADFNHNDEAVEKAVRKIAEVLGMRQGQKVMDVGHGQNLAVCRAMRDLGMQSYGLDYRDFSAADEVGKRYVIHPHLLENKDGIALYHGTIEELLLSKSKLKGDRFDLLIFWGSWASEATNYTVGGDHGMSRICHQHPEIEWWNLDEVVRLVERNKKKVLEKCVRALTPDGGLLFTSSRYAYHGGGYRIDQLPIEKRTTLRLIKDLMELGASEIYLFGLSKEHVLAEMDQISSRKGEVIKRVGCDENFDLGTVTVPDLGYLGRILTDDTALFEHKKHDNEFPYSQKEVEKIRAIEIPLGRIDAVLARF